MFLNYLKVALRNITRNKFMASLNILGLSIGLSAALVIYLIIQYQLGFDKHYTHPELIYRVVTHLRFAETDFRNSGVPGPLASVIKKEIPGVDKSTPVLNIFHDPKVTVNRGGNTEPVTFTKTERIAFVEEDYFEIFEKKWLAGNAKGMSSEPGLVVLTETRAKRYFPGTPIERVTGSLLYYNDSIQARVAGVIADNSHQSDLDNEEFVSMGTIRTAGLSDNYSNSDWGSVSSTVQLYLQLSPGVKPSNVQQQLRSVMARYKKPEPGIDPKKNFSRLVMQPLSDIHFSREYGGPADRSTLNGLSVLACFLLLLGCINFVNLSTAQAAKRAKEIGIRKTIGSSRKQLIRQFLSETFVLTFLATLLALSLTPVLLKVFKDFVPDGLHFDGDALQKILVFVPFLVIIVSLLAGFYPALVLSGFKPVLVLKNQAFSNTGQTRSASLRKMLTVFQFIIAQFFLIATIVVGRQIDHSINMDMGFEKDDVVSIRVPFNYSRPDNKISVLKNQLSGIPGIKLVSLGDQPAIGGSMSSTYKISRNGREEDINVQIRNADSNFIPLFGIQLLAGRNLTAADSMGSFLINESYAKEMGYTSPAAAVGKYVAQNKNQVLIAGVMKDFNLTSSRSGILPMALRANPRVYSQVQIKLQPELADSHTHKQTLATIEKYYKQIYPGEDFTYNYYDQTIKDFYTRELQLSKLLNWSTALSILISCLGLLGLVIYTANQRQKEIGIRKVLGASISQIVTLLSKDFLRLVIVACVIAIPLAWWASYKWLQDFPYRTSLSAWIFFAGGGILITVAFLILSIKTINSAAANPVDSLRSE